MCPRVSLPRESQKSFGRGARLKSAIAKPFGAACAAFSYRANSFELLTEQFAAPADIDRISIWRPSVRVKRADDAPTCFPTETDAEQPLPKTSTTMTSCPLAFAAATMTSRPMWSKLSITEGREAVQSGCARIRSDTAHKTGAISIRSLQNNSPMVRNARIRCPSP